MAHGEIARQRLMSQHISNAQLTHPTEVVRWMGAMQAQSYQQALWAIGLRTTAATLADVEQAIEQGEIIQTWPMRGTLHFIPAEDAQWMLDLLAPRRLTAARSRQQQLELDEGTFARCGDLFAHALSGGNRLTRAAMMALLEDAGIATDGQRGYHILWHLAHLGQICLGPMQGKEQTFVLLDEWVPSTRKLSREAALAEIAKRYFASHGPATITDFAGWAGLTLTEARAGLSSITADLAAIKSAGKDYWFAQEAAEHQPPPPDSVYLLPGFDEYLLGYKERSDVLAPEHATKIVPGGNGIFLPTLVVDGQVVGTWQRTIKKHHLNVTILPFTHLAVAQEHIDAAAQRFSAFIGLPLG